VKQEANMLDASTRSAAADPSTDQLRITLLRAELAALIERLTHGEGALVTPLPALTIGKVSRTPHSIHSVYEPSLCVIAQGTKRVLVGSDVYVYDTTQYMVFAQNLPITGQVIGASPEAPHLGLRLKFDAREIAALALELGPAGSAASRGDAARGVFTGAPSVALLETLLRLVRLLETPEDIPMLAPLVTREILYRLLKSPEGWRLAQLALVDGHSQRIAQVTDLLRRRFREPLRMDDLARQVHWSISALHHHFKAVTAMSPLQYQKQLRLQEARRVMLSENIDAAAAGRRVGYDNQSHFNREYSRFFGAPPVRDIRRLREQQFGSGSR
jgi:AraC-like DNA-binding protein